MTSELQQALDSLGRAVAVRQQIVGPSAPKLTDEEIRRVASVWKGYARQRLATLPFCSVRREYDEWACACGRRWPIGEPDPHGK